MSAATTRNRCEHGELVCAYAVQALAPLTSPRERLGALTELMISALEKDKELRTLIEKN